MSIEAVRKHLGKYGLENKIREFKESTATVEDQINAATRAYQAQGLSAWGM